MDLRNNNRNQVNEFFKGLKVVEFASVLAGPSVGMFFAELGATVIKVENKKTKGDVTRSWKLSSEDSNHPFSAYYSSVNYGKESIFLDLKNDSDYQSSIDLVRKADVLICNFKKGDTEKLGLDFKTLKSVNPKIIYSEITGFVNSNRVAYDVVLQAETGFLSMCGTESGEICKMPVALIDLLAAHQLKEGILLAMLQQQKTKKAMKVSVSLYDAALSALANQATNYLMANHIAKPMGTLHPNIAPYGEIFECKDGKKLVLAVASNHQFELLCKTLNLEELVSDERFLNNQARVKNRKDLATYLSTKFKVDERDYFMSRFIELNIPAGAVKTIKEVLDEPLAQANILREKKEDFILQTLRGNVFKLDY